MVDEGLSGGKVRKVEGRWIFFWICQLPTTLLQPVEHTGIIRKVKM